MIYEVQVITFEVNVKNKTFEEEKKRQIIAVFQHYQFYPQWHYLLQRQSQV